MEKMIGSSIKRFDAIDKVTGKAKYPQDFSLPGQLFMKCVFSMIPHAIIREIDTREAEKIPGVIAILTAKDVPCNEYGVMVNDQPVLCGPGSTRKYADRVLYQGDQVALIIAEDERSAKKAEKLIDIQYEHLPVLTDPEIAVQPDAPIIHQEKDSNILCDKHIKIGDVGEAFKNAEVIIQSQYRTPSQEHVYLQPEAGIAYLDGDQIVIISSGQWAHHDQEQIAHALMIPKERVRVIYAAIGGAFGGKEDISVQIPLALAVKHLHEMGIDRPVKTVWSREESFIGHHKRHPFIIDAKWGALKNGKIIAAEMKILSDGGAYASSSEAVLSVSASLATGPYFIPNLKIDAAAVYTNNIPNGAFRGFGSPQVTYASEMQINKIAEALGMDPIEIRLRNTIKPGQISTAGVPLPEGISINQVIKECAQKAGWKNEKGKWFFKKDGRKSKNERKNKKIGIGFACGYKSFGIPPDKCWAIIELHGKVKIEKAIVRHAGADLGQGAHSVFKQFAAEALSIPVQSIDIMGSDTQTSYDSGSSSASRMTFMAGNSILGAAKTAIKNWNAGQRPAVGEFLYSPRLKNDRGESVEDQYRNFGFGYVAEAAIVEIDLDSGAIKILDIICANDVGKAINPQQVKGQIEGSIIQALGYSLMENLIQKNGELITKNMATYLIPTIMDIPSKIDSRIVEVPDPLGPFGARGMAEMPFGPLAPAIAAAVHDATGKWINALPMTPERVKKVLSIDGN